MSAAYTNILHDRVHNQSLEIKRLEAELERAKQAFLLMQTHRYPALFAGEGVVRWIR